jgi:hypothetical protein
MKIKLPVPVLLCAAALTLGATASAPAKEKKATAAATPEASGSPIAKARAIPYHGKVASVDLGAKTFMIGKRTIRVTDQTQIRKEAAAATMSDVAPGAKVSGSCWKKDNGTLKAKSVNLGAKMEASGSTRTAQKKQDKTTKPSPSP